MLKQGGIHLPNTDKIRNIKNYVANNKFKPENILTADEWKLVSLLYELLEPFYIITQKCSKNNSLISHAAVLKKFLKNKVNSPPGLDQTSSTTVTENIEEANKCRETSSSLQGLIIPFQSSDHNRVATDQAEKYFLTFY